MGDRANVVFLGHDPDVPVIAYSHWGGAAFQGAVVKAAASTEPPPAGGFAPRNRIGDPSYFVRNTLAFVYEMVSGIGVVFDDNEHPIVVIDTLTGEVWTTHSTLLEGETSGTWRQWQRRPVDTQSAET